MNKDKIVSEYRKIREDYKYDPSIFTKDNPRVNALKEIIETKLSLADRIIILLYVELRSYRKLGVMMGLSHMTIRREVMRIKSIILKEYEKTIV